MDYEQFYATPPELAEKLVSMFSKYYLRDGFILEPSAGDGALLQAYFKVHFDGSKRCVDLCHCIEINPDRLKALKQAGWNVVWDDFMTFDTVVPYCAIMMNPPFHDGVRHLLKALSLCTDGGEIVCILNAETIKNPFSKERQQLLKELDKQEKWTCEYVEGAFKSAERKTDVEVALIHVKMKTSEPNCTILNRFKKAFVEERENDVQRGLIRQGEINQLIDLHHAEVLAALSLFDEIKAYNAIALKTDEYDRGLFEISIHAVENYDPDSSGNYTGESHTSIVKAVNFKYWKKLFRSDELSQLITSEAYKSYTKLLLKMADYDFNEFNIMQLKDDLAHNLVDNLEVAIMKTFDYFTQRFSYTEWSDNVHYYTGWKTNKASYVNKRIILPLYAFDSYMPKKHSFRMSNVRREIEDIERVFNFLDNGRTSDELVLYDQLKKAQDDMSYRSVDTKYFIIDFYKKGTAHFKFKDLELLKKFNIYVGRKRNWLPPSYGYQTYDAMSDEEKAVIDEFEGKEEYEKTFYNRDFYLTSGSDVLMLGAGDK